MTILYHNMYFHSIVIAPDKFGRKFKQILREKGYVNYVEWVRDKMREEVGSSEFDE